MITILIRNEWNMVVLVVVLVVGGSGVAGNGIQFHLNLVDQVSTKNGGGGGHGKGHGGPGGGGGGGGGGGAGGGGSNAGSRWVLVQCWTW